MVIERITGGKPQEVRKTEQAERQKVEAGKGESTKGDSTKAAGSHSVSAEVSDRSKAAIKAYRIASESDPKIGRATKMAQIKAEIASGNYSINSGDVADSILKSVAKGV